MAEHAPLSHLEAPSTAIPDIHFERAYHVLTQAEGDAAYNRFLTGDKTAHIWNREVTKRLSAYQPQFLAIDSLAPRVSGGLRKFLGYIPIYGSVEEKQRLWFFTPGAPGEITTAGSVSVIAGDVVYSDIAPFLRDVSQVIDYPTGQTIDKAIKMLTGYASAEAAFANPKINAWGQLFEMAGEDGIIALPMAIAAGKLARRAIRYHPTRQTRREFLKRTVPAAVGAAAFLGITGGLTEMRYDAMTGNQIAFTPDEQTTERLQTIAAILRPRFARSIYVDGRTALLDAKLREFMKDKQGTGAVVMGSTHDPDVIRTHTDETELIHAYAKDLLQTLDELRDGLKVKPTSAERMTLNQGCLHYLAKTDVYTVSDPGGETIDPNLPKLVPRHIKDEGTFQCSQVEQAVKGLS